MKFKLYLCIILIISTTIFSSCSKKVDYEPLKKGEAEQSQNNDEFKPQKKDDETAVVDIALHSITSNGKIEKKKQVDIMLQELNLRTMEDINTQVNIIWIPRDIYEDTILEMISNNECPDIIVSNKYHELYEILKLNNQMLDISELMPIFMSNTYQMITDFSTDLLKNAKEEDGTQYFLPSTHMAPTRYYITTRKDIYERYGKNVFTLEEYLDYTKWIEKNESKYTPYFFLAFDFFDIYLAGHGYFDYYIMFKTGIDDPSQTYKPIEDIPEFKDAWNLYQQFDGKYKTIYSRSSHILTLSKDYEYSTIILYPQTKVLTHEGYQGAVFLEKGDATDATMRFVEWLNSSQENYDLFHYGIEGEDYQLMGEQIIAMPKKSMSTILNFDNQNIFGNFKYERSYWGYPDMHSRVNKSLTIENSISFEQWQKEMNATYLNDDEYRAEMFDIMNGDMYAQRNEIYWKYFSNDPLIDLIKDTEFDDFLAAMKETQGDQIAEMINNLRAKYQDK
ncbi:MAG: extracellular solute-binding protein [Clostridiales bacterium]|nr:extracellular solute-binding protein [Clostridiales bacterium]